MGRKSMNILLTAFEPFLTHTSNPTIQIVNALESDHIKTLVLPVVYQKAADKVIEEAHKETYDFILLLGLAGDRKEITIEHHALNLMDAKGPDNEGQIKRFEVIDQKGPNLYLTDIPYASILKEAEEELRPISLSLSAGGYICNDTFYRVKHALNHQKVGFIHVPPESIVDIKTQIDAIKWITQKL